MVLETGIDMEDAIRFYRKLKYTRIENYGDYTGDELCICMKKEL